MAEKKSLSDCPTNLKEAIDWVLRVTGKDNGKDAKTIDLAGAAHTLVKDLLGEDGKHVKEVLGTNGGDAQENSQSTLVKNILKNGNGICGTSCTGTGDKNAICCLIKKLGDVLQTFIGYNGGGKMGVNGISKKDSTPYTSSYKESATWKDADNNTTPCMPKYSLAPSHSYAPV